MRPSARIRHVARLRYGAALAVTLAALVSACTVDSGTAPPRADASTPRASVSPSPETSPTPTPTAPPVLAVKIDNVGPARPQTGLDAADIVYAEQVEAGLSRLMAVYATRLPETVGPVRSARETDLELLAQFHDPTLAFSGAQSKLLPLIDKAPLRAVPPEKADAAYYRGLNKPAPHNLYLRPDKVMDKAAGAAALAQTGFRTGPAPSGGKAVKQRTVKFPAARFTFTWSADRGRWLVSMDGTRARTTDGKDLAPATVVVQHVKVRESAFHDFLGNNSPYSETVGSGTAEVLRDGRSYDVRWSRPSADEGTEFTTADGAPVNFAAGQVWVVLAKA
ncbi:DUF3048 domain-containing protein [Streptomyces sp. NPDC091292]|uniref:DUF3048 domain-containing protein n=1 Tax=Streptomyces sp. NPDC091292 TaxID=3365991 RepID=UPI0038102A34